MEVIFALIAGLLAGSGCVWIMMRSQIQSIKSQKHASDEKATLWHSQRESLSQENNEKKQRLRDLEKALQVKENEIRDSLTKISDANAKLERISDLEIDLSKEINKNQLFIEENTTQKEKISKLTADLNNREEHFNQTVNRLEKDLEYVRLENSKYREEREQLEHVQQA
ncbi:MAG: hypothetical protein AAFN00_19610, partial [Cyanobacteria bacterium J06558_2]